MAVLWDGIIPRKRRKAFEQFLNHDDPRIRAMAEIMRNDDLIERATLRGDYKFVEAMLESGVPTSMFDTQSEDECPDGASERSEWP
jgi:hypothetical protein